MRKEHYLTLSDQVLWMLAADAYERQAGSEDPKYIKKQFSIVANCLEILFDRMDLKVGVLHETSCD